MNTACPSCGAVYAVTPKDVGRKIKCKKCSTALRVDDSGLVVDTPAASPPPPPATTTAAVVEDDADGEEGAVIKKKGKKYADRDAFAGPSLVEKLGGIPTILFGTGTFLVVFFTFMTPIGNAGADRAKLSMQRLENDMKSRAKKFLPKGKKENELTPEELKKFLEDSKKLIEEYASSFESAAESAANADIDNVRSALWDKWGQLFGFLFLAFGCIGYLRTQQPLIIHIVAAVILTFMMMVVFSVVASSGCGGGPHVPLGKG
jgi:predicted Zn finger-like uncharacterized protein